MAKLFHALAFGLPGFAQGMLQGKEIRGKDEDREIKRRQLALKEEEVRLAKEERQEALRQKIAQHQMQQTLIRELEGAEPRHIGPVSPGSPGYGVGEEAAAGLETTIPGRPISQSRLLQLIMGISPDKGIEMLGRQAGLGKAGERFMSTPYGLADISSGTPQYIPPPQAQQGQPTQPPPQGMEWAPTQDAYGRTSFRAVKKAEDPWQVVTRPDGTIVRVNKQTGDVQPVQGYAEATKTAQPLTESSIAGMLSGIVPLPPGVTKTQVEEAAKHLTRIRGESTGARETERIKAQDFLKGQVTAIAAARAAGIEQGRFNPNVPLSPDAAEKFGLPFGSTWKDAQGRIASNPKARLSVTELEVSKNLLEKLSGYADKLITATTAPSAFEQGVRLWAGATAKTNADAAVFADQREALLGVFSRQIGAERGVLTDRDIYRLDKALPGFRDTKAIKDAKMKLLRSMISVNQEARLKAISQYLESSTEGGFTSVPMQPPITGEAPGGPASPQIKDLRKQYGY